MSYNWGPHFIVPSETLRHFSGRVLLRENYDEELVKRELDSLGIAGSTVRVSNPWYVRKAGTETWVKLGESEDKSANFPVSWDTTTVENGDYEILGIMHLFVREGNRERVLARQSVVPVTVHN